MDKIKFSVSMCVYGKDDPEYFDEALKSVIDQTLKPDEIVLVIDGMIPEATKAVIKKYISELKEKNINFTIIPLEKNVGHGEARRIGLNKCTNEFVAIMDADDLAVSERFEWQIRYFKKYPETSVVGGNIEEFIGDSKHCVGKRIVPTTDSQIKKYMKKRCPMNQMTVMFKREDVAEAGGYLDWYCEEDYYLWIRMYLAGKKFRNINRNLVHVRVGDEMYNRRGGMQYFRSEARLQKYMLHKKMITKIRFLINIVERFIVQVMIPNKLRGIFFQVFARKK